MPKKSRSEKSGNPPLLHVFDLKTREYAGARPAQTRPDGTPILECLAATPVAPPADVPDGHVARWAGNAWELVEDHRQHMDAAGGKQGGTPYWLPAGGDDWQSPARYMETLGPLPAGAMTERPEKPLAVLKSEKEHEIRSACDAAIVASLTMPAASASIAEIAVAAASLAGIDPDGPDTLLALHTARRDALLAAVAAAQSSADLADVEISYAV
ncbi:phage tail protein [uncultured Desulfovibrio sp.]|uniref:phage tail protein n=1 Tax=uncultured Desulfovibrio sp. TaxID=167968 RepID=UPI0026032FF5|nr:phage tail protein [uncultured Desulfovibrio sp.]